MPWEEYHRKDEQPNSVYVVSFAYDHHYYLTVSSSQPRQQLMRRVR